MPENDSDSEALPRKSEQASLAWAEYTANFEMGLESSKLKNNKNMPEAFLLPNGYPDYLRLILTSRVYDVVTETPLTPVVNISNRLGCKVLLKREDLQPVFSFKLRGAYNKMAHLDPRDCWRGVVTYSTGNHAQGVAYSARKLRIPATIVMPSGTPDIMHMNVSRLGGSVILHGADLDTAKAEAERLEKIYNLISIPPLDDPYVIAGHGTIGMELLHQISSKNLEAVFCCAGEGSLIAGIGIYLKRIAPHVNIIGVEMHNPKATVKSLEGVKYTTLKDAGLFARCATVKTAGRESYRIFQEVVSEVIEVTMDETFGATKDIFEDTRAIIEPAGALVLAGLKKWVSQNPSVNQDRCLVAIASGANVDFDHLRLITERASIAENKGGLHEINGVSRNEEPYLLS
ncbi:Threonine dehydratase [Alternaria gaisen]|nr:Threonine dehydratase [Alternaria gaisen]KAB2100007.1 Threonine dehydratase [Alternaria gaisen]